MSEVKTSVTESISTATFDEERREGRMLRKIIDLWPLWLVVLSGVAACFKFYFTVNDLAVGQARWQASSDQRRDKLRDDLESLRTRITVSEVNIEWIKKEKSNGQRKTLAD